jgi:hypothetical protein
MMAAHVRTEHAANVGRVNARVRQLLDELLQMSAEDRALVAAELDASLADAEPQAKRARVEAAVKRIVADHGAILAELAK